MAYENVEREAEGAFDMADPKDFNHIFLTRCIDG
jgi:hypothetical protein